MDDTGQVQDFLREAEILLNNNQIDPALALYQKVLALNESHPDALKHSAEIYQKRNELPKAILAYEKLLALQKDSLDIKKQLFQLYVKTHQSDRVIYLGKEIVKSEPDNLDIHQKLANQYLQQKDDSLYLQELEIINRLSPGDIQILLEIAQVYIRMGEDAKAENSYQKIIELDPNKTKALAFLGKQAYLRKEYPKAISLLENISSTEGHSSSGVFYLLASYWDNGEKEKAPVLIHNISWSFLNDEEKKYLIPIVIYTVNHEIQNKQVNKSRELLQKGLDFQPDNEELKKLSAQISQINKKKYRVYGSYAAVGCVVLIGLIMAWQNFIGPNLAYRSQYYKTIQLENQTASGQMRMRFNDFLIKYPGGRYSDDIRLRITKLGEKQESDEISVLDKLETQNDYIGALNGYTDFLQTHPASSLSGSVRDKKNALLKKIPVFSNNFEKADLTDWTEIRGDWVVWEGALGQNALGRGYNFILTGNPQWRNYKMEVKAMKTGGNEGFLIAFRAKDKDHLVLWNIGGYGNASSLLIQSANNLDTARTIESTPTPLSIDPDKWYNIKLIVSNDNVKCYLDDKLILDYSGNELKDRPSGNIGLGTWDTKALFDDLKVTLLE